MDAFIASFSYGVNKIKIPLCSMLIINFVCTGILACSILIGNLLSNFVDAFWANLICFFILCTIGLIKLFDSLIKSVIRKHKNLNKNIKFKLSSLHFIINIYADPEDADKDESKILSITEAILLAITLSLDSLTVGFGVGISGNNILLVIVFSLVTDFFALLFGQKIGKHLSKNNKLNISWLSGLIFICLGISKLII